MILNDPAEHYVTLFDSSFLPMGMALHASLMAHGNPFHLWILCMNELVEEQLERISLPSVTLIPLRTVETTELLAVKPGRTRGEYCWTLTPFTFKAVLDRDDSVQRVTYLDADLFFFASPQILLRELDETGKHVLITEHAYAPEYNRLMPLSGRFCVQFITFRRTLEAENVMRWWQEKCLDWCFARPEKGKFGDQKYLDCWPELFPDDVHIVKQTEKTLAPWNVKYVEKRFSGELDPIFYHFHGLRFISRNAVLLYSDYKIGREGIKLYNAYFAVICRNINMLVKLGIFFPYKKETTNFLVKMWHIIRQKRRIYYMK